MRLRRKSAALVLSSLAFLPACLVLADKNPFFAAPYGAATVAAVAYHSSEEQAFIAIDHGCAYAVIAANVWMFFHSPSPIYALGAASLILLSLACYLRAHAGNYCAYHTAWHLLAGSGGLVLAVGYRP